MEKDLKKMVGNGKSSLVWMVAWIFENGMRKPLIKNTFIDINLRVSDLIDGPSRMWNTKLVHDLFYQEDAKYILQHQPVVCKDDFWVWLHNKSGEYSVKFGYWLAWSSTRTDMIQEAEMKSSLNGLKTDVWSLKTSPKIRAFLWRVLSSIVSVADVVVARGMNMDSRCQICDIDGESVNHCLFTCPLARKVWALSSYPLPRDGFNQALVYANVQENRKNFSILEELRRCFPRIL